MTANPIPPDQVFWSTGSGLELWNENLLRETLEAASKNDPSDSAVQQKIGDYWAACMDESGIEAAGLKPLQPELDRIAALKSKKEITLEIAHLHHLFPGAWEQDDNQTNSPFLRFHRPAGLRRRLESRRANRSGRLEPSQSRLLPEDRREVEGTPQEIPRPRAEDVRAGGGIRSAGRSRRRHRDRTRNRHGPGADG